MGGGGRKWLPAKLAKTPFRFLLPTLSINLLLPGIREGIESMNVEAKKPAQPFFAFTGLSDDSRGGVGGVGFSLFASCSFILEEVAPSTKPKDSPERYNVIQGLANEETLRC